MFPVTLTIHDRSSLDVVLAALSHNAPQNTTVVIDETTAVSKAEHRAAKPAKTPAEKREASDQAAAKAAAGEPLTAGEAATALDGRHAPKAEPAKVEAPAALTYEAAAAVVTKVARMRSRDAAVAVLATFGASSLKDVTPDRYAQVVAACEEALK
ncbi:MAG: hypothetical protein ACK5VI_01765 [Opitutia bacterium]